MGSQVTQLQVLHSLGRRLLDLSQYVPGERPKNACGS